MLSKKKVIWAGIAVLTLLIVWGILHSLSPDIIFRYYTSLKNISVKEILYVEKQENDIIAFFTDDEENVCCSIIKENMVFYEVPLSCSTLGANAQEGRKFTVNGWNDVSTPQSYRWIAWGISYHKSERMYENNYPMNTVFLPACDFNIYYKIKAGDIPAAFVFSEEVLTEAH